MNKMNSVVHFEMPYDDRERMAKFYQKAFGWQTQTLGEEMGNYVLATTTEKNESGPIRPGAINGGFFQRNRDWPAQHPSVVVSVDDIEAAIRRVTEAGGEVLGEPMEIPSVGRYVSFFDTEANRVSMLQPIQKSERKITAKGKIAALVADGFQEEEYFLPKVALQRAGFKVEALSTAREPVEIYSFFSPTGTLDIDKIVGDANVDDYVGVLIPGGAKSPALLSESPAVREFVRDANARGMVIAAMCRGSLLLVKSDVVRGRRITGFNLVDQYPDLALQPEAEAAGATWVNEPVVVEGNLITSPHPDDATAFTKAILSSLGD